MTTQYEVAAARRAAMYEWVCAYVRDNYGRFPSIREIIDATDYTSKSVVKHNLDRLVDDGRLAKHGDATQRAYYVPGTTVHVPERTL